MTNHPIARFLQRLSSADTAFLNERHAELTARQTEWREAAVLLGLVPHRQEWQILLTRRTASLRRHSGQIALPGGKVEADESHTAAALRETFEETGVAAGVWQTFPAMPPLLSPSGYRITPIPAFCLQDIRLNINPDEVAEAFYLPLSVAADLASYHSKTAPDMRFPLPALYWQGREIWGVTAAILYQTALLGTHLPSNPAP